MVVGHRVRSPTERDFVQRFLAVVLVAFLALTIGVGAQTPVKIANPSVVVFPLQTSGSINAASGPQIAGAIAQKITELGGVEVRPSPSGLAPADYLAEARRLNADYYLTGYVTPIGREHSLLLQLVGSGSGTIAWSATTQLAANDDVQEPASLARAAIRTHFLRAYTMLDQREKAAAAQTSAPSGRSRSRNGSAAAPARPSTPPRAGESRTALAPNTSATADPKLPPVAVFTLTGDTLRPRRVYATDAMVRELDHHGMNATVARGTVRDLTLIGSILCARTGATQLVGATLAVNAIDPGLGPWSTAKVAMTGFDCATGRIRQLGSHDGTGPRWQLAVDQAVGAAVSEYVRRPKAQ